MPSPRPLLIALFLLGGTLFTQPLLAQTPVGTPLKIFPWQAARLLADPDRPRLYAALPKTDSVAVIDTDTLQVLAMIPVGSQPSDLALARNGHFLYVANRGSDGSEAVSVVDTHALKTLPGIDLPAAMTWSLVVGRNKRLYVASIGQGGGLFQVDTAGKVSPQRIDTGDYRNVYLQISPDGKTLYSGDAGTVSLDVSSPVATVRQEDGWPYDRGVDEMRLSHNGRWMCRPTITYSTITMYQADDLGQRVGTFKLAGNDPGPLAFSPDDTRLYEVIGGGTLLWIFDTATFAKTQEITLPWKHLSSYRGSYQVNDVTTDRTGTRLFVSGSTTDTTTTDATLVLATGTDTPTALPKVSIWADTPEASSFGDKEGFSVSRSGDLSKPLLVQYTVMGGENTSRYFQSLNGLVTFEAGQAVAHIKVARSSSAPYTSDPIILKLKLVPSVSYFLAKKVAKLVSY